MLNVMELNQFILKFQSDIKKVVGKSASEFIANIFIEMIDDLYTTNDEDYIKRHIKSNNEKSNNLSDYKYPGLIREAIYIGESRYHEIQRTKHRDPDVDFDCELCLIPLENKMLALIFTEKKEINQLWESYDEVSFYGYWNNVDPDENCTEEEWEQRKKDWDIALPGIGIPSENGMTIKISEGFPSLMDIDQKDIIKNIPSFEERVGVVSNQIIMDEIFNILRQDNPDEDWYKLYNRARRESKKDENQKTLSAIKEKVERNLVQCISEEDLKLKFSDLRNWTKEKTKA